ISPGVWLPFSLTSTIYDERELVHGKKVVNNTTKFSLEKAELDPKYDIALFREIKFPDGTPIYELKDNKVVASYYQGGRAGKKGASAWLAWVWWALVGALLIGAVAGGVRIRRAHRRMRVAGAPGVGLTH